MKKPNITQGSWVADLLLAVHDEIGDRIADCNTSTGKNHEEKKANARLIAAAPKIAEALEQFVAVCESGNPLKIISLIGEAKEAAKAALITAGYEF